jgi:phosphoribosyl-dephospho-CoA transferase
VGLSATARPRPHDLLRLAPAAATLAEAASHDAPAWVAQSLARAPWVVVRRARARCGRIPVGVRGATRAERWATSISWSDVTRVRTPEGLRSGQDRHSLPDVAATRALRVLAASLEPDWACWGPTGSVGFSLATRQAVVSEASDLDLLVRCPIRPAPGSLERLARLFAEQEARVDCLLETPIGAAHLDDLRRGGPTLVRTTEGARLCEDPWAAIEP